jgi:predicted DNA-binding antitoxin AbrB/MazE fold protein
MPLQVTAIYEDGVLRPLQPLNLREHEQVVVSVVQASVESGLSTLDTRYVEQMRSDVLGSEAAPGIAEIRRRLAKIPGSMAAEIVSERGDQ